VVSNNWNNKLSLGQVNVGDEDCVGDGVNTDGVGDGDGEFVDNVGVGENASDDDTNTDGDSDGFFV